MTASRRQPRIHNYDSHIQRTRPIVVKTFALHVSMNSEVSITKQRSLNFMVIKCYVGLNVPVYSLAITSQQTIFMPL